MEIFVYSRSAFSAVAPHDVPHVLISITSDSTDIARFRENPLCRDTLRLAFVDADEPSATYPEDRLFSAADAASIWSFVLRHRDVERIIVHCDAGVSRSAAVGAALARFFNGDDTEFFGGRYRPNARVHRMLLETAPRGGASLR